MNFDLSTVLPMFRAVIFDWDGTLADTHLRNYTALSDAVAPHGITIDSGWYRIHCGLPIRDLLAQVPSAAPLPIERILADSRARLLAQTVPGMLAAIPAAVELARQAHATGLRCAVASGAAADLVNAGIAALGLTGLFHAVVTRDDVKQGKPSPDTFLEAARRLDVHPADCLVVEDALDGITAARSARMRVLLVRDGALVWPSSDQTLRDLGENLT